MEADKLPPREDDVSPDSGVPVPHGSAIEEDGHWREAREAALRKVAPVTAASRQPVELRVLKRYLLAALGLVSIGLILVILDERSQVSHLTSASVVLMLGIIGISFVAVYRAREVMEGLIRTTTPTVRDTVTGLPDEQYFRLRLREECKRVGRYGIPVSLAVIDVNNLASVNEAYSDSCGDAVLSHIASVLESTKRASDIAVRLSGDEFALILLECGRDDAAQFVHRLEQYVARKPATVSVETQPITLWIGVTIGLASAINEDTSPDELLARARQDLQAAKVERDGRRERWTKASF